MFETWTCRSYYSVTLSKEYVFNLRDGSLSAAWLETQGSGKERGRSTNACKGSRKDKEMGQEQAKLVTVGDNEQAPK